MTDGRYTTSTALLEAMREAGIRYVFANLGSDHTGILEAYAYAGQTGTLAAFPELILCPHESVALSAARPPLCPQRGSLHERELRADGSFR